MESSNHRYYRTLMVKDSILAMAARLGSYKSIELNEIASDVTEDGWRVEIFAHETSGVRILRIITVIFHDLVNGNNYRIDFDVVGKNQCRNLNFVGIDVFKLDSEAFSDICFLPELFADFIATELHHRFGSK